MSKNRRFPWLPYWVALTLLVVATLFPIPVLVIESWIAEANGCTGFQRSGSPCMIHGTDWSETLYIMRMSVWLLNATTPLFAVGATIWAAVLVVHRILWGRREELSL